MPEAFAPSARLRSRAEFTAVQQRGRRVAMRHLVLLGSPNTLGHERLWIIASRRLGGAVVRNRAKRRLREVFRRRPVFSAPLARPLDLVAIPRRETATAPFTNVESDFLTALGRLRGGRSA